MNQIAKTLTLLCAGIASQSAMATVLTFDIATPGNVALAAEEYGDRVTALVQDGHSYGGGGGFTPNVVTDYNPNAASITRWTTDYGDLINIIEYELDGDGPFGVRFTADPGFAVQLHSFDLGGWPDTDYVLPSFEVLVNGVSVYSQNNVAVEGTSGHSSFDLAVLGLSGSQVELIIHQETLGGNSDNIGLDNVLFTQSRVRTGVPDAGSMAGMLALASGIMALAARRAAVTR
jgi:hypothetical protein